MRLESASSAPSRSTTRRRESRRPSSEASRDSDGRTVERGGRRERGGQKPALLHHPPLLRPQELPLVDVQVQKPHHRKEDEQKVEGEQADRYPRKALHGSLSPGSR